MSFNDVYKAWRNRARKYNLESIVHRALDVLCERETDRMRELEKAPWLTMLMVKWVCQDRHPRPASLPSITPEQFDDLRQRLWELNVPLDMGTGDAMPLELFMRRILRPQLGFQRGFSKGFVREGALIAEHGENHPLRKLFKQKTGFDVLQFIDLSVAICNGIMAGKRVLGDGYLTSLHSTYPQGVVSGFEHSVSRTLPELIEFCRSLPHARQKVASEYFEFPVLTRYPFFRKGDAMVCWHPAMLYRGLESFVHSILSEEDDRYMERFSRLFEQHVVAQAKNVPAQFLDEHALRQLIAPETQVPDGLLSFPGCNVFIESKAGLYRETVMTVGSSDIFRHMTKEITKAVRQSWATSVSLREERRAPPDVLDADTEYLLIVNNKELGVSKGTHFASIYPDGTLEYPNAETERLLPHNHIYVLSIDDFERLTNAAASGQIELPAFLASCVRDDEERQSARHLFEQHLNGRNVPMQLSDTVEKAIQAGCNRIERALGG